MTEKKPNRGLIYNSYFLYGLTKGKKENFIKLTQPHRSNYTFQTKSDESATNSLIKKSSTRNSISNSRKPKIENKERLVEIANDSKSETSIKNNSQELLVLKVKTGSNNDNDLSPSNPKEQSRILDNIQNSEVEVVKEKLWDQLCSLGKNAVQVQQTIKALMELAMAINDNKLLCTDQTLTDEGSGHNRKYVVTTIYEVLAALGSRSSDELETSTKLFNLTIWLSSRPPPKSPATENKAPKSKGLDLAKSSGPELTDAEKTKKKDKKKTEQGAEDSGIKFSPKGSGNGTSLANGGDEKKDSKESAKPAPPKQEDVKTAAPGKEDQKPALPANENVKPAPSGKEDAKPALPANQDAKPAPSGKDDGKPAPPGKEGVKPAPTGLEGFNLTPLVKEEAKPAPLVKEEVKPTLFSKEEVKTAPSGKTVAPDAGVASGALHIPAAEWHSPAGWPVLTTSGNAPTAPKTGAPKPIPPPEQEVKSATSGKTGTPNDAGVAGWRWPIATGWPVPATSGDVPIAPKTGAPKPITPPEVPEGQALHNFWTCPKVPHIHVTESQAPPPTHQTPQTVYLGNTHSGTQFTVQATPQNGEIGNHNIFGDLNPSQPHTQFETGNHHDARYGHVSQPHTQLSDQQAQQAPMGNNLQAVYSNDPQTQTQTLPIRQTGNHHNTRYHEASHPSTQLSGQQGQQVPMGNRPEAGYRDDPKTQTQFLGHPTQQIRQTVNHQNARYREASHQPTQLSGQQGQQAHMGNHPEAGYCNDPQIQSQFLVQPKPQTGEPGSHPGFEYRNVPLQQAQFPGRKFSPATGEYIPSVFVSYAGAESQNPAQTHGTQQAGGFGSVDGISQYHSTNPYPFPVQQTPQVHANGRQIKPHLSFPLTDISGGTILYPSQGPADGRSHHMDSARQAFSSPRKTTRPKSKLPGSYDQDDPSDSSASFTSSESEWDLTRDTDRGPNDQDRISKLGGHDTRRSRHENYRSDRVNSSREEANREDTRRGRQRRQGSRLEESSWEDLRRERPHREGSRRENSNREYVRRRPTHREGHRVEGTYSKGSREYESVRDKTRANTAHAEDLQTTTSKKIPAESAIPGWADLLGFGVS